MAPDRAIHYGQDVSTLLPIMEQIADEVEIYFEQPSISPDVKREMGEILVRGRKHIDRWKSLSASQSADTPP